MTLIKIALRVLAAYREHTEPNPDDIDALRRASGDPGTPAAPDELAVATIHRELLAGRRELPAPRARQAS
jgi:hypothetical protein